MRFTFFKGVVVGAALAAVVLGASEAIAGTGIGGVFNLGASNSVNATTGLTGSTSSKLLNIYNSSTSSSAGALTAIVLNTGQVAVDADSEKGTAVRATTHGGSAVSATSVTGSAISATSSSGPLLNLTGPDSGSVKLNGSVFPSATEGTKAVMSWSDTLVHTVGTLANLHAGSYLITANATARTSGAGTFYCDLAAESDQDAQTATVGSGVSFAPVTLMVVHQFTSTGSVTLNCQTTATGTVQVVNVKIIATRLSGVSTASLP